MKHTEYCNSDYRGYVMPSYYEAIQKERKDNALLAQFIQSQQGKQDSVALKNFLQYLTPETLPQPQTFAQTVAVTLARPVLILANLLRAFGQQRQFPIPVPRFVQSAASFLGTRLNQAVSNILSFFFRTRQSHNEVDLEDMERRTRQDAGGDDMFSRYAVSGAEGSNMGGA